MENKQKYSRFKIYLPFFFALVLIAGFILGLNLRPGPGVSSQEKKFFSIGQDRYDKVNDIINYIYESYVDTVSREELKEEAIKSLLKNLDPHSSYIPASAFREMNDPLMGGFEGIGIEFNMTNDTVVVINPIAGGPSETAGIMPGDRIVKVEGESIAGVNKATSEVVSMLKGKKGTKVNVSVFRRGVEDLLEFELVRDKIPSYSLDIAYMVDPQVGYIRLNKFSATTHQEFVMGVEQLDRKGMEKLVLDLRGNGGGFLDAAINLADELLEPQKLIVYTDGRKRPVTHAHARRNGIFEDRPLIVLIDEWSASASEIIAGAVQDNDRGLVIGRRSFGKGLVQEQVQLGDGSAMRLTVARYFTPTGRSIQKPYENGQEEYFTEFLQRFYEGELEHPDSIHFDDSLRFETPAGREVYGGGGIMPDIFIPLETGDHTRFFNQVSNRGLLYRFAFDYADRNRSEIERYESPENFVSNFNLDRQIFNEFLAFVKNEGVSTDNISADSEELTKNYLKAYMGRNIFGMEAFFPVLHTRDKAFQKALEVLQSDTLMTYLRPVEKN